MKWIMTTLNTIFFFCFSFLLTMTDWSCLWLNALKEGLMKPHMKERRTSELWEYFLKILFYQEFYLRLVCMVRYQYLYKHSAIRLLWLVIFDNDMPKYVVFKSLSHCGIIYLLTASHFVFWNNSLSITSKENKQLVYIYLLNT